MKWRGGRGETDGTLLAAALIFVALIVLVGVLGGGLASILAQIGLS